MSDKTNDKTNKKKTKNKKTKINLITGDCVEEMAKLPEDSVDAIVTDPPYGLKFMGKEFDDLGEGAKQKEWHKAWAVEALRVLKPGGHLLAFGGTRTYHHLATAVEEAGFEVRDQMQWLYGSGFPKSLNVGKAIDKKEAKRPSKKAKDVLKVVNWFCEQLNNSGKKRSEIDKAFGTKNVAQYWFSPHREPAVPTLDKIETLLEVLGVKPEEVPEDIARLLLDLNGKKGQPRFELAFEREVTGEAGALWEDWETNAGGKSTKPRSGERRDKPATKEAARWEGWGTALKPANEPIVVARKPFKGTVAENVLEHGTGALNVDGCRVGSEERETWSAGSANYKVSNPEPWKESKHKVEGRWPANVILDEEAGQLLDEQSGIKEGPARFFYCPKAAKKERNAGLEDFEEKRPDERTTTGMGTFEEKGVQPQRNNHPTVKPIALMAYLIRLVTPPGGTVLDPFLGSGSTGLAAIEEEACAGFIGIEKDPEYIKIAKARVDYWQKEKEDEDDK